MKKITIALTLILCCNWVFPNPIDTTTAKQVAVNFWKQNTERNRVPDFVCKPMASTFTSFYVLSSIQERGFVIVSADDRVQPILGYSEEGTFDVSNMPPNLRNWLMGYEQQIHYAIDENIEPSEETVLEWNTLLEGGAIAPKSTTAVNPLLTTQWDQSPYYNQLCPSYLLGLGHTQTGCVATAMAQVMKYWNYPTQGSGYHSYNCNFYGTQSANFANTTYDWSHMPDQLSSSSSNTQINAIATLMYHCGVSVDMDYGWQASSINDITLVVQALKKYFRYDTSTHLVEKNNYSSDAAWINVLKNELNNGRPIFYVGSGSGGHAFVCDGYNNSNYFHFNWGWSGFCDGYYSVNNLTPDSGGTGAGSGSYTNDQKAVIGIQPSTSTAPEIEMYSDLSVNDAWFLSNITGTVQIVNIGTSSFSGELAVVIFNEEGIYVDEQIFSVNNLTHNHYTSKTINISGGTHLIPGTYYALALYSEDGNNWDLVPTGTNAYPATTFDITFSAPIETNSAFSNTTFVQGETATVNVGVWNSGSETFYGKVGVKLAKIEDGSVIQTIQEINIPDGLPANSYYINGLNFAGTITATPGTYLMALAFQISGQTQWYYAGSSNYRNPVFVTVVAAPTLSVSPSSLSFQQTGGNQVVNVTSNVSWNATSSASWLTITPNSGTESESMIVSASTNNSSSSRSATITITGTGGVASQTITVTQLGGIQPDQYEENNTSATAYNLGTVNSSNVNYNVNANFHITTDKDYYKINLPSGYSYTINADLSDSYNNSSYTADAKLATSQDGSSWSSNYGSAMPAMTMDDGGTLYFRVLPYTDHEIGTYQLQITVTRSGGIDPDQYEPNNTSATAYNLGTMNISSINYNVSANFHITTDNDYYKINLPSGYSYTINANILNSYNNTSYTADAKFATSQDGVSWSSNYGNAMSAMTMSNGGMLYFRVLPYTDHEIGTYQLQISIVRSGGAEPDIYEPNNTVNTAYLLSTISGPTTSIVANASFHTTSDVDYYRINLPPDYTYNVYVSLLDCNNDNAYTVDAKMAVSSDNGNTWSSYYDNYIPIMTVEHSGQLYYHVIPQQSSAMGTYRLNISVSRTTGIQDRDDFIVLYPNPTSDYLHIVSSDDSQLRKIDIFTIAGQFVKTIDCEIDKVFDVSQLPQGTYIIKIQTSDGLAIRKFVKS